MIKRILMTTVVALSGAAIAQDDATSVLTRANEPVPFRERETLTGDWGGLRLQLADHGVKPFLFYDSVFAASVDGGIRAGSDFAGQVYGGFDLDFEKLLGWRGATAKISYVQRHGDTVNDDIGAVYDSITIFGGQVGFLYQAFLEQQINDQWSVKLGRVSADTDFAKSPIYGYSSNTAINGPIRATLLDGSITSFPFPVWGARVKYKPNDLHQFQVGAYQTGPDQFDFTRNGLNFGFGGDDGISVLAQYDFTPQINGQDALFFAGVVASYRKFDRLDGTGQESDLYRFYAHGEFFVNDGLKLFGLATYAYQDAISQTPTQISVGANYKGLISSRPKDHTFFHATYGRLSRGFGESVGQNVDFEIAYELGHRIQLTPAAYFQPALQYIQNPGGTGELDDAFVVGAWLSLAF